MGTSRTDWSKRLQGPWWGQGVEAGPSPIHVTLPQGEEFVFPPGGALGVTGGEPAPSPPGYSWASLSDQGL